MQKIRTILISLLCIAVLISLVSCKKNAELKNPAELVERVKTCADSDIKWITLSADKVSGYFGFSGELATEHCALINEADERYDMIAVFNFSSEEDLLTATAALRKTLNSAAGNFKTTNSVEAEKITSGIILRRENSLAVAVLHNFKNAKQLLEEENFKQIS